MTSAELEASVIADFNQLIDRVYDVLAQTHLNEEERKLLAQVEGEADTNTSGETATSASSEASTSASSETTSQASSETATNAEA